MLDQIKTAFTEVDQKMLETQMAWAMERKDALKEYTDSYDRKSGACYTTGAHQVCGGKTWYNVFFGRNKDMVAELIVKNVEALIEKRNARIVAALTKKGVTELPEFTVKHDGNGWSGKFDVAGNTVTIETILAGGYHIQCLHQRTLVKVKAAA
jgi:hypothetical protein